VSSFTDQAGRVWTVELYDDQLWRIYCAGIDLMAALNPANETTTKTWFRLLWAICSKQADLADVGPREFIGALSGPAISDGIRAIHEAFAQRWPGSLPTPTTDSKA